MIELNDAAGATEPPEMRVDVTDGGKYLSVDISLPGRWSVAVSQELYDPDEPFTSDDVQRLTEAALGAARVLITTGPVR
jgi:hypothetical protein